MSNTVDFSLKIHYIMYIGIFVCAIYCYFLYTHQYRENSAKFIIAYILLFGEINMKKLKSSTLFLMLLTIFISSFLPINAFAASDPDIKANAVLLIEASEGDILYAKNEHEKIYPASTTKIMTVLLALEAVEAGKISLDEEIVASETIYYDIEKDGTTQNIRPNETLSFHDVLRCALISSANEACNIIAECVSGNAADFIELMNTRAKELGCENTNFVNTHGMPDDSHYTTAHDLYLIFAEAQKHAEFTNMASTATCEIPATNMFKARKLENTNKLIVEGNEHYYEYATGGKTGSTDAAGHCLVTGAEKDGLKFISIVMGVQDSPDGEKGYPFCFSESARLLQWGYDNFSYHTVISSEQILTEVPVLFGEDQDTVRLHSNEDLVVLLNNDIRPSELELDVEIFDLNEDGSVNAPIETGEVMGKADIYFGTVLYGTVDLVAENSITFAKMKQFNHELAQFISRPEVQMVLVILVLLLPVCVAVIVIRMIVLRKREKAESKRYEDESYPVNDYMNEAFHDIEDVYSSTRRKK